MISNFLMIANFFVGIGGLAGGFMALSADTRATLGLSRSMLANSPFTSFLIPGLFLLLIIGAGNLLVGYLALEKKKNLPYFECIMGGILCVWIIVQCIMLVSVVQLHIIFFLFGCAQFLGGFLLIKKNHLTLPFSAKQN